MSGICATPHGMPAHESQRKRRRRQLSWLALTALLVGIGWFFYERTFYAQQRAVIAFSTSGVEGVPFELEVADEPAEHALGLMFRRELPPRGGMLFIFPEEGPRSFYMKNTYLSLDILYLNREGEVVHIYPSTTPFDPTGLPSRLPAKYVVELLAGTAAREGIVEGSRARFVRVPRGEG